MFPRQRQGLILERIRESGGAKVADLARVLGVSDMTVRRDLAVLREKGLIEKVHGGATAPEPGVSHEPGFGAKVRLQTAEKDAIAATAAALVEPGDTIGISAGTTTRALALRLADVAGLTVVTNSMPVAEVFDEAGRDDQTVILTGGVRTPSDALVGPFAVATLRQLHVDLVFMGIHGMEPRSGFTTPNLLEADTNRAMVACGRSLVIVGDSTKWGTVGISSFAGLDDAHILVTDTGLPADAVDLLGSTVGELLLVETTAAAERTA